MKRSGIIILIFFIIFLIISIQKDKAKELKLWDNDLTVNSMEVDSSIVDAAFVKKPFRMDTITISNLRKLYSKFIKIGKEPIQNLHIQTQTDTLITVKIKNSEFIFYKIPGQEFLESATVKDSVIKFSRQILVGMTVSEFMSRFDQLKQLQQISPTLSISGEEGDGYFIFTFYKKKLIKVEFFGYID
jgi:hypothetical protein